MSVRLNPYLILDGTAKEAIHFYEKALGGKIMGIMTYGDIPEDPEHPLPEGVKDRVMHALLKVGDDQLMFSDTYPGMPYQPGNTVEIALLPTDELLSGDRNLPCHVTRSLRFSSINNCRYSSNRS